MDVLARVSRMLDPVLTPLQPLVLFGTRLYLARVFIASGWLKLTQWPQTLDLFTTEYHVPVLPPMLAAIAGTTGELLFPSLLVVGFLGRPAAVGLFFVNAMAVISYRDVLFSEGFEAAIGQHVLWGFMTLVLAAFGPGGLSIDRLLKGKTDRA
jgi:putative oxidoreductase